MDYGPEHLIAELLTYRRAPVRLTKGFREWRHNRDLCPRAESQCELILGAFRKYRDVVYNIQGLRDEGTDVLLRLDEGADLRLVCLQIKSDEEATSRSLADTLILQWQRTIDRYGPELQDYFVLLCWDATARDDEIRNVQATLAKKQGLVLIHPQLAWSFLNYSGMAIDALARIKVGSEDAVIRAALRMASDLSPTEIALLIGLTHSALYEDSPTASAHEILNMPFISTTYDSMPAVDREYYLYDPEEDTDENEEQEPRWVDSDNRLAIDLDYLEQAQLISVDGETYRANLDDVEPLIVLLVDGRLRYDYSGTELMMYVLEAIASPHLQRASELSLGST